MHKHGNSPKVYKICIVDNFIEQYSQQQGHGQANGEHILLITLARVQYTVEDPVPRRLVIF